MPRRPLSPRVRRNRAVAASVAAVVLLVVLLVARSGGAPSTAARTPRTSAGGGTTAPAAPLFPAGSGPSHLAPGSDPGVLPGDLLIADEGNNRLLVVDPKGRTVWTWPQPGDLAPGVQFQSPDDAFFTPDGRDVIATEEEFSVVTLIDVATRRILWRYGTPGMPGDGPNQLSNPDDALVLPDGSTLIADIKNCRVLLVARGGQAPARVYGTTTQGCRHAPPDHFGSPNGAFPMANGHYLVTEINGDWVDDMDLQGTVYGSWHPPGVAYPSDTNEVHPGTYLTVDYSSPGQIVLFDRAGQALWRYRPTGDAALDHPSLALPLPNGDVIATDDHDDRIVVVDPRTSAVVWQYGVRGRAGSAPGLLDAVDGLDLAPPYSDLVAHASTMGEPAAP